MLLTPLDLRGVPTGKFAAALPRPAIPGGEVAHAVAEILAEVRDGGDSALRSLTERFDGVGASSLRVAPEEVAAAVASARPGLVQSLRRAWDAIVDYHRFEAADAPPDYVADGVAVRHLVRPVERAGIYAPGGRAVYPSSVLMCAAPARAAGVERIVLCAPPDASGHIAHATLVAASVAGVDEVYAVGGAQAIAAMAFGTETVGAVDVIAGPGNAYVAEAKRQVAGRVGVAAAFAGPSEVVVVADASTDASFAAVDLAVQAEHGPDGLAWLVTWDEAIVARIEAELRAVVSSSPRREDLTSTLEANGYAVVVDDPGSALAVVDVVAPEHLELLLPLELASALAGRVRRAGAVFVGEYSPASIGDYMAGPNHVLPTARTARFASALRADDFRTHIHAVTVDEEAARRLAPDVITLAEAEGLPAHALAVEMRLAAQRRSEPTTALPA